MILKRFHNAKKLQAGKTVEYKIRDDKKEV